MVEPLIPVGGRDVLVLDALRDGVREANRGDRVWFDAGTEEGRATMAPR